jgi:hypothetical protein
LGLKALKLEPTKDEVKQPVPTPRIREFRLEKRKRPDYPPAFCRGRYFIELFLRPIAGRLEFKGQAGLDLRADHFGEFRVPAERAERIAEPAVPCVRQKARKSPKAELQ